MKIVLFGKNGQVGRALERSLPALGAVVAVDRTIADLENPASVQSVIAHERPDFVVNAAAYTAVDKAESEPERARRINAESVGVMADEMARLGGWIVHYSTDYVFDGTKPEPYVETDSTNPLSVYGATKLEGERLIATSGCRHLIFRTSWVFADRGHNFLRTILRLAAERDELSIVADQVGSPTSAALLAEITATALRQAAGPASGQPPSGIYHACPAGATSWHGYAQYIVAEALDRGATLRAKPESIRPIPTSAYPLPARRPANSLLHTAKLLATFDLVLPPWQRDVATVLEQLLSHSGSLESANVSAPPWHHA